MASPRNNTLLTDNIILKTALMEFDNNLVFAKTARRDYEDKFNANTGKTLRIRKPTRYVERKGQVAKPQPINEQYTEITVSDMIGVDVEISSEQYALELEDFNQEVIQPAMVTLANAVDQGLYNTTTQLYNFAGTAGSSPASFSVINQCNAVLNRFGIPRKDRFLLLKTDDAATVQSSLYNTFNEKFNKEIILDGEMGNLASFDVYDVQNAIRPSAGTSTGSPVVTTSGQSGATLNANTFTPNALVNDGALFTIAGVNSVNPTSREDTGQLAQFTITVSEQADGSGNLALSISPPIVLTGPYQNVTVAPAAGAAITFQSTHTKNVFYHREAFALCTIKLPENKGAIYQKNMVNPKSKSSIRMTRYYDGIQDVELVRFDVLPAYACFPEYGGVLMGS